VDGDPLAFEAWLRLRHARLVSHRAELRPGQFKLFNNLVGTAVHMPRTPPTQVAATLRVLLTEVAPRIPAGAARIVFLYSAIVEVHAFTDGNGRVVRFAFNRWLVGAGRFPHLRPKGYDGDLITQARETGDPGPLVEWLAAGSRYAAALDREWAERPAH
jgi:hypothetical protein